MRRLLRYLLRKFYLLLVICVITLAVLVQLGRSFSYLVADYQPQLEAYLSQRLQGSVSFGDVHAQWEGLQPVLELAEVTLADQQGETLLSLQKAHVRLDLQASLLARELVWGEMNIVGAQLELRQLQDGRWQLMDTGANTVARGAYRRVVDMLLAARRIAFDDTVFHLHFYDDQPMTLRAPTLQLENQGNFHRLSLQLGLPDNPDALFFIAEAEGDPRSTDSNVKAYLQLHEVPTDTPMTALSALLAGSVEGLPIEAQGGQLEAKVWLSRAPDQTDYQVLGELSLGAFELTGAEGAMGNMDAFSTVLAGAFQHPGQWQLGLRDGVLQVDDAHFSGWQLGLSSSGDEALQIHFDALDLERLHYLVTRAAVLEPYPALVDLFEQLQPRGELTNLWVRLPFAAPADWSLATNLQAVDVSHWYEVPAFQGVSGYLYTTARNGYVQVDTEAGFSAAFADVYEQPLQFDAVRGQVAWSLRPEENLIYINSGRLQVRDGEELAQGHFWLSLPWQPDSGDIDLIIHLGAQQMSADQHRKYVPVLLPEGLREWISRSLGNYNPGFVDRGGFLFRGTLNSPLHSMRSFQLLLEVEEAELDYYPGWPGVKDIAGRVLLDDEAVTGHLSQGRVYNSAITSAQVQLFDNPEGEGLLLTVEADMDGLASDGLRILRQSLLRQYVGDAMDTWYLHGGLTGHLSLAIPLQEDQPGTHHALQLSVAAPSFSLDNYRLELTEFNGQISYDSDTGIASQGLQAKLLGEPVEIQLATQDSAGILATTIDVATQVTSEQLMQWAQQPGLNLLEGEIPLQVHVAINHLQLDTLDEDMRRAAVAITADLQAVKVNLPAPLGKSPGEPRELSLQYIMGTHTGLADVRYGNSWRGLLLLDQQNESLQSAIISNLPNAQLPMEPALLLKAHLPELDMGAWQSAYQQYQPQLQASSYAEGGSLPLMIDLKLDAHQLGPLTWDNLHLQGRQLAEGWDLLVTAEQIQGEIFWPQDPASDVQLRLDLLALQPSGLLPPEEQMASVPQAPVPDEIWQQLRPAQVSIGELRVNDEDFGRWQFALKPYQQQLALLDIEGHIRGLDVGGTEHAGAYMIWYNTPEDPYTGLSARLHTDAMGEVLEAWGLPRALESDMATFDANLYWRAPPQDISLDIISGNVETNIDAGRFLNVGDSAGQGLLRLLGLFNFDSLARRLRLDFSDLYKSGLTFDEITGEVSFAHGQMQVTRPMVMRSPSSQMQLSGQVDLREEMLNMRLVATLPVAGNLTVITALAAGLPAAAGVFLISKIFEREMQKVASVSYVISGDWDDPKIVFDRLFDADSR